MDRSRSSTNGSRHSRAAKKSADEIRKELIESRQLADRVLVNAARVDSGDPVTEDDWKSVSEIIAQEVIERQRREMPSQSDVSVHGPAGLKFSARNVPSWIVALTIVVVIAAVVWAVR